MRMICLDEKLLNVLNVIFYEFVFINSVLKFIFIN